MIPQVVTQIQVMYASHERAGPMAAFSTMSGLAAAVGPILGPVLLEWGAGWRLTFWVNVPITVLTLVACLMLLPDSRSPNSARLDIPGFILSVAGLLLVFLPLISTANGSAWSVWMYASTVAGVAVLAWFVIHEQRVSRRGGSPLLETSLFRFRSLGGGLLVLLLFFAPTMGFFLVLMLFLQTGVGMSPMNAGFALLPWPLAVPVFASLSAGLLLPRIGRMTVQLGLVVMALGLMLTAFAVSGATPGTGWTDMIWGMLIGGAGMGLVVAPLVTLTLNDVPVPEAGSGSGLYNTVTQLAASVGVAVVGTYFFTEVHAVPIASPTDRAAGYGSALASSLWLAIGLLALAFAVSFLLPRRFATTHQEAPDVRRGLDTLG